MKYRLLAPGPTPVPDSVLREMSQTLIHHRTDHFERIFSECKDGLKWLLETRTAPLVLSCSGTGAFEAGIENFLSQGDTILCITGGKFAENWLKMSACFGLNAVEILVPWGKAVTESQVKAALASYPEAKALVLVASETSTGVRHPFEAIGALTKNHPDCLFVVDGVTAVGVFDIAPERHNIDVLVFGSQKGLMLPPGLGFIWASEKAWARARESNLPKFYFDLAKEKKAQTANQTGHTPAVSLIMGLKEALLIMKSEGREAIFSRHLRLAKAARAAASALGLELFAESPTEAITSIYSPKSLEPDAIYQGLMKFANFTIAGGQEQMAGKIFRIGHMGYVDDIDLIGVFGALEIVLKKLGYEKFSMGASIAAASPILKEGFR
ncbi:MAG TPA: alanine--glyoxylate aminotransferase family protein [Myxococcota bacterium]|nr:alanine--glyoxylate aminotransferase family protein [Myxococcota bacterium]